ncbi:MULTISPECIES: GntR family transcriptional regulator [Paraburkholderia]|uniref:GntR family transcriptional regulator n=1 Tax=Paraburkholderia metrosideri TaxID=580937 RepID=A0ABW9E6F2_9BURK
MFSVSRPLSLRSQALEQIRRNIITGVLPAGELYSEQSLADKMGVSRSPVREALLQLASEGLVELIPHRGVRIALIDPAYLTYILEFRAAIDGYCARTLASNPRRKVLEKLDAELARQRDLIAAGNWESWPDANMDFHSVLARSVGNPLMESAIAELGSHMMRLGFLIHGQHDQIRENFAAHTAIVDAIRKGDPATAQALACEHLQSTEELIKRHFGKPDDSAGKPSTKRLLRDRKVSADAV